MIKLLAIVGPTASGKTALAVELAKRLSGEIVGADSMQIYKDMQIATAKPTADEICGVKYHLIDFLELDSEFSVADYVKAAHSVIAGISDRGNLPIVCGGTGLYVDSLLSNLSFSESETDPELRKSLMELAEKNGGGYLLEMLREFDPEAASRLHENNIKRIIRAIEIYKTTGMTATEQNALSRKAGSPYDYLKIFLNFKDRERLYERIDKRVDEMVKDGLKEEAERVLSKYDLKTSSQAIGYKELMPYFEGKADFDECVENLKRSTRRYAKRQITWFKRDESAVCVYADLFSGIDELTEHCYKITEKFLKGE